LSSANTTGAGFELGIMYSPALIFTCKTLPATVDFIIECSKSISCSLIRASSFLKSALAFSNSSALLLMSCSETADLFSKFSSREYCCLMFFNTAFWASSSALMEANPALLSRSFK